MPRIIIQTDSPDGGAAAVTLTERVIPVERQTEHYLTQLVERIGWALVDAEELEADEPGGDSTRPGDRSRAGAGWAGRTQARRVRRSVLGPRFASLSRTGPAGPR
jgi:hypothetical protein